MDVIKLFSLNDSRARFLLVDAYNTEATLSFYLKNEFSLLFSSEDQEAEYFRRDTTEPLKTRMMYFDLLGLKRKLESLS